MGLFDRIFGKKKYKTEAEQNLPAETSISKTDQMGENFVGEIENKDLLFISYDKNIPSNHNGIKVSLNINEKGEIEYDTEIKKKPDPSTIWVHLPIKYEENPPALPYFPHYIDLLPSQRYKYLNWLRNIDNPIDVGYVFLYFYGLEKHLLIGDIEKAIKQIIRLRKHHFNKSFQTYSRNSIIHSCIMRNRLDILLEEKDLFDIEDFTNTQLLLAQNFGFPVGAEHLIYIFYKLYPKCRKAIKEDRQGLLKCIEETLMQKYNTKHLSLEDLDLSNAPITTEPRFCNYTFPHEIRFVEITDYFKFDKFIEKIDDVFNPSYELYKSEKRKTQPKQKKQLPASDETKPPQEVKQKEKTTKTSKKSANADQLNQQFRLNDILRWQTQDFIIGYEIRRGNREKLDQCRVCEKLVGKYPKSFIWTGWHEGCICRITPIMEDFHSEERKEDRTNRLRAALYGTEYTKKESTNHIKYLPKHFMDWYAKNKDNETYKNAHFITQNKELIEESELHY
ncbi:TerB N-terminal domain-containing protein [Capnocytophaga canis]|uniref:TerB N-terminal domain-containing protein n=1 Tax=Capnocytophaga canis TaxID=1848903 RepID=UPI0037D5F87E